jgi:hypothetical protein
MCLLIPQISKLYSRKKRLKRVSRKGLRESRKYQEQAADIYNMQGLVLRKNPDNPKKNVLKSKS